MKKFLFICLLGLGVSLLPSVVQGKTLYECYQAKGLKWGSVSQRATLAAEVGIPFYKGTAIQNILLSDLMCNKMGFSVATGYQKQLSSPITSSQSYIPVTSLTLKDNTVLSITTLGDKIFLDLEPGGSKEELVLCTGIDAVHIWFTGCTRGLYFSGTSTAAVVALQKPHSASSPIVMSNVHYVYEQYADVNNKDQSIDGLKTFVQIPLIPITTPTLPAQIASKKYVDDTAFAGVNDASTIAKGIIQIPTAIQIASSTAVGSTGGLLVVPTSQTSSSPHTSIGTGIVPATQNNGKISDSFTDFSTNKTYTGLNTFTATTTMATTTIASSTINNLNVGASNQSGTASFNGTVNLNGTVNGAFQNRMATTTATSPLVVSADTSRHTYSTSYVKMKEIQTAVGGRMKVDFTCVKDNVGSVFGRVYKNDVAFGTEWGCGAGGSCTNCTDNLWFSAGDSIQLYGKGDAGGSPNGVTFSNFRIYYDIITATNPWVVNNN